ncbi:MAG TPA: hypothetical protein VE864_03280, partial [Streptosporangiaceae bacterium]|nr:hypothetical protein [Streptosporangiaceae bacterium]
AADSALYRAKDEGRDQVRLYAPGDAARPRRCPDGTPEPASLIPAARDPAECPAASPAAWEPEDKSETREASDQARHPSLDDRADEGADEAEDPAA